MTVNLSENLAAALNRLAQDQGRDVDVVLEEAVKDYLVAASITDVTSDELSATQAILLPELHDIEGYDGNGAVGDHAAS